MPLGLGAQIHPAGQHIGVFQIYRAVGILGESEGEQQSILGVAGFQIHLRDSLIGYRIAGGVQAQRFVVGVQAAGEHIHRLNHMGMAAHDHIKAHVAQLLGDLLLLGAGGGLVFIAPVDEHHRGFGTGIFHLLQALLRFLIKGVQLGADKGIHKKRTGVGQGVPVHVHLPGYRIVGQTLIGVVHHANFDAADVLNGVFGLCRCCPGAQHLQTLVSDGADGAQEAVLAGVVAVVVGGEQQIKPGAFQTVHNFVGAVEGGVAGILVALVGACQSGFQVGNGQVGLGGVGGQVLENGIKIVAAVALQAGVDHRHVHQHVPGDGDGRGGDHMLRLRRFSFGGLGFLGAEQPLPEGGLFLGDDLRLCCLFHLGGTKQQPQAQRKEHQHRHHRHKTGDNGSRAGGLLLFAIFWGMLIRHNMSSWVYYVFLSSR